MGKIYVASSWRNERQPEVVRSLRECGHEVYDFREPRPGARGFHWSEIDPDWQSWTPAQFRDALEHPIATHGCGQDLAAMVGADTFVLVLPCGRSAHLEIGWAVGRRCRTFVLLDEVSEPELMYGLVDHLCVTLTELIHRLRA